ncbi:hypothetical protein [Cytophaga aurantiaca]|uniref:hypothetical protein n=1 Tax=Cytophaga aurantiaca TaxID=29530 RepID=UPI0012FC0D99|nr:hypothetical protein [Cytophaga aurantiaca]
MIKYILYFLCSTLLFSIAGNAQQLENESELLLKSPDNIYSAVDRNDNYVFVFQTNSQYEFVFFDAAHKKAGDATIAIPSAQRKDTYLGIEFKEDTCSIYSLNTRTNEIIQSNIGRGGNFMSKKTIGRLAFTEKYLKCISLNDNFYILTATQGKNQLEIHSIANDSIIKNTYPIEMPDFYKKLSSGNHLLNEETQSSVGIDAINYNIENNVKSARATKKIYAFQTYIYLVFDDPDYTQIIQIDLKKNVATYKQFEFSLDHGNTSSKKQGNSFLYNQTLFRVTMSLEQMTFTTVNIETHESYSTFYATPHNPMNFKNGPIAQENSSDKLRIIDDNATYFKKVLAGALSIAVNQKDTTYIVEIGSYEEIVSNNNYNNPSISRPTISIGMGMGMGGMGMGMGMGGMGSMGYGGYGGMSPYNHYGWDSPGYYNGYSGYYPYNSTTTTIRTIYVHSMLNTSTYAHQAGIVPITLRERVSNFETETFKNQKPEQIRVINFRDKILIGYMIPNKKTFKQYSFYK